MQRAVQDVGEDLSPLGTPCAATANRHPTRPTGRVEAVASCVGDALAGGADQIRRSRRQGDPIDRAAGASVDEGRSFARLRQVGQHGHPISTDRALRKQSRQLLRPHSDQREHPIERGRPDHRRHRAQPDTRCPRAQEQPGRLTVHRQLSGDHLARERRTDCQQSIADLRDSGADRCRRKIVRSSRNPGPQGQTGRRIAQLADGSIWSQPGPVDADVQSDHKRSTHQRRTARSVDRGRAPTHQRHRSHGLR